MNKKKAALLCVIILIMAVIFRFSAHTGSESSELSIKVTRFISRIIFRNFGSMTLSQQQFIVSEFHHFIRKLAHFTIYAVLGMSVYSFTETTELKLLKRLSLSWVSCIIYAAADEFHQSFTPGRSMQFTDVMIDSAGAFCGIIAAFIIFAVFYYIKRETGNETDGGSDS